MYVFREAIVEDIFYLEELYRVLNRNQDTTVVPERIQQLEKDPDNFLFVVCYEGKVIATISLGICLNGAFSNSKYGVIENIIVDEHYRKIGIGKIMLEKVEFFCKKAGCTKIMIFSSNDRIEAHNLFREKGFDDKIGVAFKKYLG